MLTFADIPNQSGGWLKPAELQGAVAILVEVKSFERQRPTPHGPKDSALVDISAFMSPADLDNGEPEIQQGVRVEQTVLARDLGQLVGQATVVTLAQVPSKTPGSKPAWVWRQVDRASQQKVVAYATKREAALQAAMSDAPDFD
ncbi:hypothetical protein [Lentzea sp. CC55]|uniref:hypothetical protein n=1 Tax=Lentzea sp. CC55 TaxID=2884909 RepID=UPI001F24CADF|nr:hypothetical protein [Lentzea sp. CC55]MCG8926669.1 hypothetical protein [Lentzea sp. CC55]